MTGGRLAAAASVLGLAIVGMLWVTGEAEQRKVGASEPTGGSGTTIPPKSTSAQSIRPPEPGILSPQLDAMVESGDPQASKRSAPDGVSTGAGEKGRDHPDEAHRPGKVIPHPLGEARMRDMEQRQLFADVEAAIELGNYERARSLLAQYDLHSAEHEAWSDRREAYQLIADCKQYASTESRASGQRFVDEQRGSTLRRSVRRACLDGR